MASSSSIPQKRDLELSPEEASLSTSPKRVKDEENGPSTDVKPKTESYATDKAFFLEADMGITAYMAPDIPGFEGLLKTRFSDFQVNEVLADGTICHLESTAAPAVPEEEAVEAVEPNEDVGYTEIAELVNDEAFMSNLRAMVEAVNVSRVRPNTHPETDATLTPSTDPEPKPEPVPLPDPISTIVAEKSARTKLHKLIEVHFGSKLDSQGAEGGGLFVRPKTNQKRGDRNARGGGRGPQQKNSWGPRRNNKKEWELWGGEYTEFTLYKENMDTMNAISKIAAYLRMTGKSFSYAGTKDKRAVTTQKVTVSRVMPWRLEQLNKGLRGMQIGDYRPRQTQMTLGESRGNHFKIVLRDVQMTNEHDLNRAMSSLRDNGFVNYFGMQRFGTRSLPTYAVGIAYLGANFERGVEMIMEPKEGDRPDVLEARRLWREEGNAAEALKKLPKHLLAERSILQYFKSTKNVNNYLGALEAIPRNLRLMYLHSYQSFVWNNMATERLKLYGPTPVVGDLVDITGSDLDIPDEDDVNPSDDDTPAPRTSNNKRTRTPSQKSSQKILTIQTPEQAAQYTFADVVLPLPGYDVEYPTHALRSSYTTFMAQHNVDPFSMHRKHNTASLPGSYRKIICKPRDVAWKLLRYIDPECDLAITDLERVQGRKEVETVAGGGRVAVVVEFTLGVSQYATMALRECAKMETASGFHERTWVDSQNKKGKGGKEGANEEEKEAGNGEGGVAPEEPAV
ncbi:pseudouridine synthase [Fimicolochytrium jonesii]|uniref:pseudouridine synthase n=1 Tax=Fimicolochytrium jonesii TaxID=1396493 RepID=UPI0022FF29C7|nr:pseudouridine synthase [Fimicolochytrium jonesii]KAI8821684.1 pseudouridine synthase [Fimicolochytrium jonesii]